MAKVIKFMSHQSVAWALDATQEAVTTPTEIAVLVALIEFADNNGRGAFPSAARIAFRARCSPRTVRRILKSLVDRGVLEDGGIGPHGLHVYHAPGVQRDRQRFGPIAIKDAS
jgi:hypothetical protein